MQFALGVILFFLGFGCAAIASIRPKQTRADIDQFFGRLRYVLDSLRPGAPSQSRLRQVSETSAYEQGEKEEDGKVLWTKDEVEKQFPPTAWQHEAYLALVSILHSTGPNHSTFPCVYATKGFRHNEHRYVFLHSDDPSEPRNIRVLAKALSTYLPESRSIGKNTSLLVVCPPGPEEERSFEYYNHRFWELLRGLRIADPNFWPKDIPQSTLSSKWAFCYAGIPLFPVALTPLYKNRRSRWAPNFVIAMQPKWVFDELLGTEKQRNNATKTVRGLLEKYDAIPPSPDLTAYGTEGTSEVHQLFLRDDNEASLECPFGDFDTAGS